MNNNISTLTTRESSADEMFKMSQNCKKKCQHNLEFHDHIWNHHDKYIQKSTNMPAIGSLIREMELKVLSI